MGEFIYNGRQQVKKTDLQLFIGKEVNVKFMEVTKDLEKIIYKVKKQLKGKFVGKKC